MPGMVSDNNSHITISYPQAQEIISENISVTKCKPGFAWGYYPANGATDIQELAQSVRHATAALDIAGRDRMYTKQDSAARSSAPRGLPAASHAGREVS